MAFEGNLIYIGSNRVPFPNDYIFKESFNIAPCQRQDINSYQMATGELVRKVADHTRTKVFWNVPTDKDNRDIKKISELFTDNYISEQERKVLIRYYDPEIDDYREGLFYKPNITYVIKRIDEVKLRVIYAAIKITLIEY